MSPTYGKSCRSCQAWDPLCSWQEGEQQLITVTATVITIAIVIVINIITTIANVITIDYNHQRITKYNELYEKVAIKIINKEKLSESVLQKVYFVSQHFNEYSFA